MSVPPKMFGLILLSLNILIFTGCNSTVQSIKNDTETIQSTDTERGYLLIGVETNANVKAINIDGPQDIALSHLDLRAGSNFILVPLIAGTYEIDDISFGSRKNFRLKDKEMWGFVIKPQTISYVGHLEIQVRGHNSEYVYLELVNRSTEALDFMQQDFPSILKGRELYYGGPGDDDFFVYLKQLGE